MGFIKHALIGIALYEVGKCFINATANNQVPDYDLDAGNNPEAPLTGNLPKKDRDDPWKNSLANDELRAPDS
ncbi:hypothetical protein [Pedobacter heparinus]|uniref:hypothetical protein n=1 Tax=Pedobacter heparinus TaxID=984 RepID=UPI0029300060|nr:hypothetical protein [Pedobacter heparinus]